MLHPDRFTNFRAAFSQHLRVMVAKHPDVYGYPVSDCPAVVTRICNSVEKHQGIASQNIDSPTWRAVCKSLGIKHTRKALTAYLSGE